VRGAGREPVAEKDRDVALYIEVVVADQVDAIDVGGEPVDGVAGDVRGERDGRVGGDREQGVDVDAGDA
jgi:hypothetical protein